MSPARGRTLPVLLAAVTLVGAANVAAYAVNGRPIIQGLNNQGTVTTTITNSGDGAALKLKSRDNEPPLAVTSSKKVTKLNADEVDGQGAAALGTKTFVYTLPTIDPTMYAIVRFPGLPDGRYQATFAVAAASLQPVSCSIYLPTDVDAGVANGVLNDGTSTSNGSTFVSTRGGGIAQLICQGDAAFSFENTDPKSTVLFTRLDQAPTDEGTWLTRQPH